MNCRIGSAVAVLAVLLASGSLQAHHSLAAFDTTKALTVTGTLTKVDWRNPHIELALDAKSDGGQVEVWTLVGAPPFFFRDRSISKSDFQKGIGQTVTVEAYRAKNGTPSGVVLKITFLDGRSVTIVPDA